jgi:NifU-like protein involved in Fe-S cluster formation
MSPELTDHFQNPRNVGDLPAPAITVEVSNPICGDILRLSVLMEDGKIREARYKVWGCAASIGAGSALTEMLIGRSLNDLKSITRDEIDRAVGGLSNESKHAAQLCRDALTRLCVQ